MTFFQFGAPNFLFLLLLLPFIAWWAGRSGPVPAIQFSSTSLVKAVSRNRRTSPGQFLFSIRLLTLAALIIALARPQMGKNQDRLKTEGIDIVITLDMSGSMRGLDLSTNDVIKTRLDVAKQVVSDFIDNREFDRIGLVAFGESAYIVSPLTLNHDWLKRNLARLELGEIDGSRTAIGTALGASSNRLRDQETRSRIVILLTDGENNTGSLSPMAAAEAAKTLGVKVYTIATGRKGPAPVAQIYRDGRILRDKNGQPVPLRGAFGRYKTQTTNYDETELTEIAEMTGGRFFQAFKHGDLERIYDEIDELETTEILLHSHATFTELFFWPAFAGLALLVLEQILSNTRYRRLP